MKGYQSPAEHARQVAMVKASLVRSPAIKVQRPEYDTRRAAAVRVTR